jgi:hypothetical protein
LQKEQQKSINKINMLFGWKKTSAPEMKLLIRISIFCHFLTTQAQIYYTPQTCPTHTWAKAAAESFFVRSPRRNILYHSAALSESSMISDAQRVGPESVSHPAPHAKMKNYERRSLVLLTKG